MKDSSTDFNACVCALESGLVLSRNQWRVLLEERTRERQEVLAKKHPWSGIGFMENGCLSGD